MKDPVALHYELRARLYSVPSSMGAQLERLQGAVGSSPNYAAGAEPPALIEYLDTLGAVSDLTPTEYDVLGCWIGSCAYHRKYRRRVALADLLRGAPVARPQCGVRMRRGAFCEAPAVGENGRCRRHGADEAPPELQTRNGETFVRTCDDVVAEVEGVTAVRASVEDIAARLRLPVDVTRRALASARCKVLNNS